MCAASPFCRRSRSFSRPEYYFPLLFAISVSPEALSDLIDLYDYIALRDDGNARLATIDRIEDCCRNLSFFPGRCMRRDELRPGLRILGFQRRAVIAFLVATEAVTILRCVCRSCTAVVILRPFFPELADCRMAPDYQRETASVGASLEMCRYSIPQMAFAKYLRSSLFVNPASCETLFRRTSTNRFTSAFFSRVRNVSADFFVKPMVKIFIPRPCGKREPHQGRTFAPIHTQCGFPVADTCHQEVPRGND